MATATTAGVTAIPFPAHISSGAKSLRRRHCFGVVFLPVQSVALLAPNSTATCRSPSPSLTTTPNIQVPNDAFLPNSQNSVPLEAQTSDELRSCNGSDGRLYHNLMGLAIGHGDLELGKAMHAVVLKRLEGTKEEPEDNDNASGEELSLFNKLIYMYVKLGRLVDARKVFDGIPFPDVVSYSTLISGCAKSGAESEVVGLFSQMRNSGVDANQYSLVAILASCIRNRNFELGTQVHALATKTGHLFDVYVGNALMGLYAQSGFVDDTIRLFNRLPERDTSSWNTVISGLVKESRHSDAFDFFGEMQSQGIIGDQYTISSLLTAAEEGFHLDKGEGIHAHAIKLSLGSSLSVGNALISFYTSLGHLEDVIGVFQSMPTKDIISWTGMVTAFMEFGKKELALEVFSQMAEKNCITYNSLLAGFCRNGDGHRALELFLEMVEGGVELSEFTLSAAINACALFGQTEMSKQMHGFLLKVGCGSNSWIDVALMDMFVKCNRIEDAEAMFDCWEHKDSLSVAWTSLVSGYARNGQPHDALSLFSVLGRQDLVSLDEVAVATILGICGCLGLVEMGKQIHCYSMKLNYLRDTSVGNAICSMYSKCGYIESAIRTFRSMHFHDVVSWNTLITAHLLHRHGDDALNVWNKMETAGVRPDHITFTLILSSCKYTNSKSSDTCQKLFASMTNHYGLIPSQEHYATLVRVLGHWDCFDEAKELIKNMPMKPDVLVWRALLDSCRLRSNVGLGRQAAQQILELRPMDPSTYVLVSNLYSSSGRWHCSEKAREEMKQKGMLKIPAKSWIVHKHRLCSFYTRDRSHPQSKDIYSALDILVLECTKVGYVPDTSFVLHEVEEYQKKDFLFYHSAKLAVTFGILSCKSGKPIKVMKNIVLCGDCHSFLKHVSTVTGRVIHVRDATGFHCFKSGQCSCRDCW